MTVESSKTLAGIGSILLFIPFLNIVGLIFVFMGMKDLSEYYKDPNIVQDVLMGGIFGVIGFILSFIGVTFLFSFSLLIFVGLLLCIVGFVFELLMASRIRKALYALADRSGEKLFHTAGTLLWYGAILTIIGVGVFLIAISYLILAIAFFTLKLAPNTQTYSNYVAPPAASSSSSSYQSATQQSQYAPASNIKANFCPNCGSPVTPDATFCSNCGKQI